MPTATLLTTSNVIASNAASNSIATVPWPPATGKGGEVGWVANHGVQVQWGAWRTLCIRAARAAPICQPCRAHLASRCMGSHTPLVTHPHAPSPSLQPPAMSPLPPPGEPHGTSGARPSTPIRFLALRGEERGEESGHFISKGHVAVVSGGWCQIIYF